LLFNRHLIVAAGLLLLTACATTSKPPIAQSPLSQVAHQQHLAKLAQVKSFALKGRLGVVTQKQGFSGGIDWQHTVNTDNVDVFSPLGGKVANISKNATGVTLTKQEGRSVTAQDAESLTETALGFKLPLSGLGDWALGRPTESNIISSSWDENGRLLTLKQDGWDISYENYTSNEGVFLPSKIVLKSERVNLKLLVEKWMDVSKQ
jgi:outer membrane lipoprotein LolB